MKKLLIIAALAVAITGCTAKDPHRITPAESAAVTTRGNGVSKYTEEVREMVKSASYSLYAYKGKRCAVRVQLGELGELIKAKRESGDRELCAKVIQSLHTIQFPKYPDAETYRVMHSFALDFMP